MQRLISYNLIVIVLSFLVLIYLDFVFFLQIKSPICNSNEIVIVGIIINLVFLLLAGFVIGKLNNFLKGGIGEREAQRTLNNLPQGYSYLKDIVIGKKLNIDFVVIGPTGVWTIEVKNYNKKEILEKNIQKELSQAYAEKSVLQNFLDKEGINVPISPVLVFTNKKTKMHFGMAPVKGVYVIRIKWLQNLLSKHSSGYMDPEKVKEINENLQKFSSRIN